AHTPNLDRLFDEYPHTAIKASGEAVGLPPGQMGNSEVGHLNLGAGRVVFQDLTRINHAIDDRSFFKNPVLIEAFTRAIAADSSVHLLGLLSDGGVHSDLSHLKALIEIAAQQGCKKLFLHLFLDGRDVSPRSGIGYVEEIIRYIEAEGLGRIATISGRFYAMDRDNRWDRVELAYAAMVRDKGPHQPDALKLVRDSYADDVTDEFVMPAIVDNSSGSRIRSNDSVIFFNFRPDRARELTRSLLLKDFDAFDRGLEPPLPYLVTMTEYDDTFTSPIAFPPEDLKNVLPEVIAAAGKTQLHIAETEKYAHVTFFFNGGNETTYQGEERKLIPSPTEVATYDKKPEMSARLVTNALCELLDQNHFDFVIINFANCDMVGHTGIVEATVKAVEVVDECVGRVVAKVSELSGVCLITSDHGNAESMTDPSGGPDTAHSTELVPFIVTRNVEVTDGRALCDVAPTILDFMRIKLPPEMTGHSIVINV
ncbi:MAG: 2,3-bisphosphoglycerate-independent phosphoglycerate mutase, partial [Thermoleophilia bacterium]|nr:2,3-bisphosphoglycerate-independent phosphoglycerate mutase [Thermoleophilia bacterium]